MHQFIFKHKKIIYKMNNIFTLNNYISLEKIMEDEDELYDIR